MELIQQPCDCRWLQIEQKILILATVVCGKKGNRLPQMDLIIVDTVLEPISYDWPFHQSLFLFAIVCRHLQLSFDSGVENNCKHLQQRNMTVVVVICTICSPLVDHLHRISMRTIHLRLTATLFAASNLKQLQTTDTNDCRKNCILLEVILHLKLGHR